MGLLDEAFFADVEEFIHVEPYRREKLASNRKKARVRIEVLPMPLFLEHRALFFTMPCVACGAAIHPFRRRGKAGRGATGRMYYAPSCPLDVNIGCSRGAAAKKEYEDIRKHYGK